MAGHPSLSTNSGPVERAFLVLQTIAAAEGGVGVRQLGRLSGLPRSTAARLASQLIDLGMLVRRPNGDLAVGPGVMTLQADSTAVPASLEDQLRPLLFDLVTRFGESAALTIDTIGGAHYLAQIPGPSAVQVPDSSGSSLPFHVVAPGLVLMSVWPSIRLTEYTNQKLQRATPHSVVEPLQLIERVADIANQGFAWTDQEFDLEVNGLAVPIKNRAGATIAAVSLYGPSYRLNPKDQSQLGTALARQVTERASFLIG